MRAPLTREGFRPCIDLHDGAVKQIVGGTLRDDGVQGGGPGGGEGLIENFVSEKPPAYYAALYRDHGLRGGHVIKLGEGNDLAAEEALRAWPGGLQIGGGITAQNAARWLEVGASHVIVTSYVFKDGELDQRRLDEILAVVGKECLVLDLSCRRKPNSEGIDEYFVVTDRWQKFTSLRVDESTLRHLATFCDEFLVHGVDVEGTQTGLELPLLEMLGQHSPIRVTYAGGARDLSDCETVARLGSGRVGLTVGSALDIFGGELPFAQVLAWHKSQQALGPPTSSSESTAPARL